MIKVFLTIYNLIWLLVLPFLKHSPRIAIGWNERILKDTKDGPFDIWIQAASGGEAQLSCMLIEQLAKRHQIQKTSEKLKILATSGTKEGIESLDKGLKRLKGISDSQMVVATAYFPFDAPWLMKKAFDTFRPRLAVIIETELWPAFLVAAKNRNIPVLLVNGRMSEKSHRSYKHLSFFFHKYGPKKVCAISPLDGDRFTQVVGRDRVKVLPNIKFDRIKTASNTEPTNPLTNLLPKGKPFVLLGSIRKEEEEKILTTIANLLNRRPEIVIGLFPKHIERADRWVALLAGKNIKSVKRSQVKTADIFPPPVIIWDVFGELAGAYSLAHAAFVGGSLVNLGGQNFLEPLVFGLRPIIGPYWKNFAWVGREIVAKGLVTEVESETELTAALQRDLEETPEKDVILDRAQRFFEPQKGGTDMVCEIIYEQLLADRK